MGFLKHETVTYSPQATSIRPGVVKPLVRANNIPSIEEYYYRLDETSVKKVSRPKGFWKKVLAPLRAEARKVKLVLRKWMNRMFGEKELTYSGEMKINPDDFTIPKGL